MLCYRSIFWIRWYENIDSETIQRSYEGWDAETSLFNEILLFEKKKYEKRYKTEVLELALCGRLGLWNGSPIGGKMVTFSNPIGMTEVNDIDITMEEDRTIVISGHHHDGSHHMCLYFLTASAMKKAGIYAEYECSGTKYFEPEHYEAIYNKLNPVKLSKNNKHISL